MHSSCGAIFWSSRKDYRNAVSALPYDKGRGKGFIIFKMATAETTECSNLLINALKLRPFKTSNGKSLRNRLSNITDEELMQQIKDDSPDRFRISRKGFNIERDHRQIERKAVKSRLRLYHLGQGTTFDDILKVLDALTKRDYPNLDVFDGSQKLQIFIPDQLLTASPQIIGEAEYLAIRSTLQARIRRRLCKLSH